MGKLFVGCSGFNYRHWRGGVFYPESLPQKEEFNYYASIFNTVEINSTFYGLPIESTWKLWKRRAPEGFIYSVKMTRFLTHNNKLLRPEAYWYRFWAGAQKLDEHLGPILFQLPPKFATNTARLVMLSKVIPHKLRVAFEFRDESWFDKRVYKILKNNNWALVFASHLKFPWIVKSTADYVYLRFHGVPHLYSSNYQEEELEKQADSIRNWLKRGLGVYAYFNNDAQGFAPKNALTLLKFLT